MARRLHQLDPPDAACARLRVVHAGIARWHEWAANEVLPEDPRGPLHWPGSYGGERPRNLRRGACRGGRESQQRRAHPPAASPTAR